MARTKTNKKVVNKSEWTVLCNQLPKDYLEQNFVCVSYVDSLLTELRKEHTLTPISDKAEGRYNANKDVNAIARVFFGKWNDDKKSWDIPEKVLKDVEKYLKEHAIFWKI